MTPGHCMSWTILEVITSPTPITFPNDKHNIWLRVSAIYLRLITIHHNLRVTNTIQLAQYSIVLIRSMVGTGLKSIVHNR